MRGRKPKPTHLKLLEGNPGQRRINRHEPRPEGDLTDPPEWMTAAQKEGWRYAIDHAPRGLLKRLDRAALVVWVVAEQLHREASELVARHGLVMKAPHTGQPMQSPWLPIVNRQAGIMLKAAAELGFTPSARSRIAVEPDAPHGKFEGLIGGRS
jgi:P27 family predicted phage terminase small subunit